MVGSYSNNLFNKLLDLFGGFSFELNWLEIVFFYEF